MKITKIEKMIRNENGFIEIENEDLTNIQYFSNKIKFKNCILSVYASFGNGCEFENCRFLDVGEK